MIFIQQMNLREYLQDPVFYVSRVFTLAGIPSSTAYAFMNGKQLLKEQDAKKLLKIAKKYGYKPQKLNSKA